MERSDRLKRYNVSAETLRGDAEFTRVRRERNPLGSARVSRVGERVLAIADFR